MFQLTKEELEKVLWSQKSTLKNNESSWSKKSTLNNNQSSWSKNLTLNVSGNKRGYNIKYLPYAFTESGIYMLMTVLRGPLATEQSRKLINAFKAMKDYIVSSNHLLSMNEVIGLVNKVNKHDDEIKDVKNQLTVVMDNFIDPAKYEEFQILDGMKIEAQEIYKTIFRMAKKSIYILDNYISTRTLKYLKICPSQIEIIIVSDNISFDGIDEKDLEVFKSETGIEIPLLKGHGRLHDRYIVIDYDTPNEIIYHSGPSIKDAGNKIATVDKLSDTFLLHDVIKELITR